MLLIGLGLLFVVIVVFAVLAALLARLQARVATTAREQGLAPPLRAERPPRRPHNPHVDTRLAATLPADTIRGMYRAAGLADPSCHCELLDVPHLREQHP